MYRYVRTALRSIKNIFKLVQSFYEGKIKIPKMRHTEELIRLKLNKNLPSPVSPFQRSVQIQGSRSYNFSKVGGGGAVHFNIPLRFRKFTYIH
jgi:hypothetical protein